MTDQLRSRSRYEQALNLAEEGKHQDALAVIGEHLAQDPHDGQALNDLGTILYALGQFNEAADHLEKAVVHLGPDRGQALWNLYEVYLAAGRPGAAVGLFPRMAEEGLLTADVINRTATSFLDDGDVDSAIEALIQSLTICPEQELLIPMLEVVRAKRAKVAFFCENGDLKFMQDIFGFINARFNTELFRGASAENMREMLEWCDIAWFEWCTEQVVQASAMPKSCRMIVRLHRYEAFRSWPEQVDWSKIDALVTVGNSAVLDHLRTRVPCLDEMTCVVPIPNGVDLSKFAFLDRTRGKNLAVVAHINYWKNPMLLMQCFAKLHEIDPEYKLHFAGPFQDDGTLKNYLPYMVSELGLEGSVFFEGWQDDVASWLEDKHYLISGSLVEGHPVNVLEGMARGLKPVVHTFPGCRDFLQPEHLFRTVDEFCSRILEDSYEPKSYRDFVASRFSLDTQLQRVKELFLEMEQSPAAGGNSPTADLPQKQDIMEALSGLGSRDLRILALGCRGDSVEAGLTRFGKVAGIDPDEEIIAAAIECCPEGVFICGDFFETQLGTGSFDVVVSNNVLSRISHAQQAEYLKRAFDLLKCGGSLLMKAPDTAIREAVGPASDRDVAEGLADMVRQAGFDVVRVEANRAGKDGRLFLQARKKTEQSA